MRVDTADLPPPVRVVLAEDEAIIRLDLRETLEDEATRWWETLAAGTTPWNSLPN